MFIKFIPLQNTVVQKCNTSFLLFTRDGAYVSGH